MTAKIWESQFMKSRQDAWSAVAAEGFGDLQPHRLERGHGAGDEAERDGEQPHR